MSAYDRLLKTCMEEFEREVMLQVERAPPDEICKIIGETYDPRASPQQHAAQKQRVIAARCAQRWFELEAPPWAQPLPLTMDACHALLNNENRGNQRLAMVAQYGRILQDMAWDCTRAPRFEVFCAQFLMPPSG